MAVLTRTPHGSLNRNPSFVAPLPKPARRDARCTGTGRSAIGERRPGVVAKPAELPPGRIELEHVAPTDPGVEAVPRVGLHVQALRVFDVARSRDRRESAEGRAAGVWKDEQGRSNNPGEGSSADAASAAPEEWSPSTSFFSTSSLVTRADRTALGEAPRPPRPAEY